MLSKTYFTFPYYDYPYTYKEKFNYYIGKILCMGMYSIGTDIYARVFLKQPYFTNKQIVKKNNEELQKLISNTSNSRKWHINSLMINFILVSGIYGFNKYQYISDKYTIYAYVGSGLILINNIYGILAHTYNNIRYNKQLNIINHGIQIERAAKAIASEMQSLGIINGVDQESIDAIIYNKINEEKNKWLLSNYYSSEQITYVVYNSYYENLFFTFNIEKTANDFIAELEKIDHKQIDYLSNNPIYAQNMKNEFIKNRIYTNLIYGYYTSMNNTHIRSY